MKCFLRKLKQKLTYKNYNRLVEIFIDKNRLLNNLHAFQKFNPKWQVAPVLKSNCYGHGLGTISKILDQENLPFFCVDSFFEAVELRHVGIKSNILIFGYTELNNILESKLKNVAFAITSMDQLQQLVNNLKTQKRIHLKFDTGMHRQGILISEVDNIIKLVRGNKNIFLEGIFSHLADADVENSEPTLKQIKVWNNLVDRFLKEFPNLKYYHLAATSGYGYKDLIKANIGRLGRGMYGIRVHSLNNMPVDPVLKMNSKISSLKEIDKGESVGYNFTFTADKKMKIATIPLGYYEGLDRRLSGKGFVKIKNIYCPIIGRVSMNITSIDVSKIPDIKIGDTVEIISCDSVDKNSIENMAADCNAASYEILVHLAAHLRRTVI